MKSTRTNPMVVTAVIARRELLHFIRQPVRIAAAVGTTVLIWLFLSSSFADALQADTTGEHSYAAFLVPGMMTLIVTFAAIFASISIIEERDQGWLQSVLVSPAPRWSIALGKVSGGAIVAWLQAVVLVAALPLVGVTLSIGPVVGLLIGLALTAMAMSAVGLFFAWRSATSASFHAVMNLVFMPMWLLSGAFFSFDGASTWLAFISQLNPLTWCTQAIRLSAYGEPPPMFLAGALAFAIAAIGLATWTLSRGVRT